MQRDDNIVKIKSYEIYLNQEIGRGQFGVVYLCKDLDNPQLKLCAKIIQEKLDDPKTKREIELMKIIMINAKGNQNIVGVEYVDFNSERIVLILEKCESDLQSIIDKKKRQENKFFTPSEALKVLKHIVNGYKMLYSNNIIHRDLKPANILVLNGIYKIADLGLARVLEQNEDEKAKLTKVGTPKYAAPQLYFDKFFTNSADIFSLGIIIYELIFGQLPYVAHSQQQIRRAVRNLDKDPVKVNREWPEMTSEFADLIECMLKFSEEDRISWEQLFKHPIIQEESNLAVNRSCLIQTDSDEEQAEKKPNETQNNDQEISPNLVKATYTGSFTQQQQSSINPHMQQQFTNGQVKTSPFIPSFPVQTGNNPNSNTFVQPKPIFIQPARFQTIQKMHVLGQPLQFQQVKETSDKLFQVGFVMDQALESLEKYFNMQVSLKAEFFGIKLYLHCLSQCFYEHSNAMLSQRNVNYNQLFYSSQVVDQELQKQIKYHQVIAQEIERFQLASFYPVVTINPDFLSYLQKLNRITQAKGLFLYANDKKYYPDYIQMLYLLERLKELNQPSIAFEDLYLQISDIQINKKNESHVTDYINKRLCN